MWALRARMTLRCFESPQMKAASLSHDFRTMPQHFQQLIAKQASPGLILIPQKLKVGAAVEELLMIWAACEAQEWVNQFCYLPL